MRKYLFMESKNYSLFKKVILKKGKSCIPQFDGLIHRTTGEQIIRVKCYLKNYTAMAFESKKIKNKFFFNLC